MSKTLTTRRQNAIDALRWTTCLVALAAATGCSLLKKEEAKQEAAPAATDTAAPAPAEPAANAADATRYPDEIAESGTIATKRLSVVRKSADQTSEILARLNAGTAVNRKARRGAYYLIEFPSGNPVTMKPGWVVQDDLNTIVQAAATTTATTTASAAATTTATPTATGTEAAATAAPTATGTEAAATAAPTTTATAPAATTTSTAAATVAPTAPVGGRPPRLIIKKPLPKRANPTAPDLVSWGSASPSCSDGARKVFSRQGINFLGEGVRV